MGAELGQGEELGLDELGSFFFFLKGFGFCFLGEFLFVFCFPVFCLYSSLTSQPASLSLSLSLLFSAHLAHRLVLGRQLRLPVRQHAELLLRAPL